MKNIRISSCMSCSKGYFEFDISLIEKQICSCNVCGNQHKVRPYKNGRISIYNLDKKSIGSLKG